MLLLLFLIDEGTEKEWYGWWHQIMQTDGSGLCMLVFNKTPADGGFLRFPCSLMFHLCRVKKFSSARWKAVLWTLFSLCRFTQLLTFWDICIVEFIKCQKIQKSWMSYLSMYFKKKTSMFSFIPQPVYLYYSREILH